ncbi:STAS/SEC14 domain-containing protein [Ramlibacter sp. USB13]|uniref:STAS/SEC14 domain-containing protein n=1 Tax=Ramlibacter cellulosilyticus TaxID=2764187 RepID=A0A923SAP5_9BURK|nr:STAS/SEC14 domain-containing protein [Ramlibacter cellulosilyticus]MBC5782458.1 STAS/SEC14 domain-containing protein [Ramlibacter cellulosilyticus]
MQSAMNFDVTIDALRHFMRVTVSGAPALDELLSMIHLLGVESETWQEAKVLVDLRGVTTPFTRPEQFRIGEEAAASLSHMDRIASLVPPERVTRVSEKAARRNGTNVRVFGDERAAVAWLVADLAD